MGHRRWTERGALTLSAIAAVALLTAGCDDSTCGDGSCGAGGASSAASGTQSSGSKMSGTTTSASGGTTTSGVGTTTGGGLCDNGPLTTPIANCAPAPLPSTGDPHQDCVDRINQLRAACQCLPPLARWTAGESCTDDQAGDDQASDDPHSHFPACGENAQNTCPNWPSEGNIVGGCLQDMWDEGPGDFNQGHGHYLNMSSTTYKKVACGFSSGPNGVWSNQNFAP